MSLNPVFRRDYSALFTALDEWEPAKADKNLAQLAAPYLSQPARLPFWLLGTDVTPQPRPHARTLEDRSYVHQPNLIKSHKPITIGHAYSSVALLPEEEGEHGPAWVVPLGVQRVPSRADKEMVGARQMRALLDDPTLPFHTQLCVEVEDSGYSKARFFGEKPRENQSGDNYPGAQQPHSPTAYRPPTAPTRSARRAHPTWYGAPFSLAEPTTWSEPDETTTTTMRSLSGKTYRLQIEAWHDMRMAGKCKPVPLPMHLHPFTLVRVRLFNVPGELAFQRPLWLIVMGDRRRELTLLNIFQAYQRRYDLEHFFRFGKQRLLTDRYQTPDTDHEDKWWLLSHLAYLQLWVARPVAQAVPRPWETAPREAANPKPPLSATHVQRDFARLIRQFGTPAAAPKRRGISVGRPKGAVLPHRSCAPVVCKSET